MLTNKRHEYILNVIKEKGSVTVLELQNALNISESTVRRDLTELDKNGRLCKVFGGAVAIDSSFSSRELSVSQKQAVNLDDKIKIAKYAASLIRPDDFIYIDAGTTTGCIIDFLTEKKATYVTNAVSHARLLAQAGFHVIIIGGELKGTTEAIVGSQALISLSGYHFTKGFFGTNGISRQAGFTTPDDNEAAVKRTAMEHCRHNYILADTEKFGKVSPITFAAFDDASILTTDAPDGYRLCSNLKIV